MKYTCAMTYFASGEDHRVFYVACPYAKYDAQYRAVDLTR